MMSLYSFSTNVILCVMKTAQMDVFGLNSGYHFSELQNHIKPSIYSARRKQLRGHALTQRMARAGETPQISFVSQLRKMSCDTHSLSDFTDVHYARA